MMSSVTPVGARAPYFGKGENQPTRRSFISSLLLGSGMLALGGPTVAHVLAQDNADRFVRTAPARAVSSVDAEIATFQFDRLVERYYYDYDARHNKETLKAYHKQLEDIDTKALDQQYQGLYMIVDHHIRRRLFELEEQKALQHLGVEWTGKQDSNRHIMFQPDLTLDLHQKIYPKPSRQLLDGGVGKRRYDAMLELQHFVNLNSDELIRLAKAQYDKIEAEMRQIAAQIDPNKDWREIYRELRKQHPKQEELLDVYRQEVEKARAFLKEKDLITLPPESLRVIETPPFYRRSVPYAAYIGGPQGTGTFMVTTVVDNDPQKAEEQLQAHSYWFIPPVVVHEAFPGHHLQHVHDGQVVIDETNPKNKTLVRVLNMTDRSTFFIEGWGLYSEVMMRESGYYDKPEAHLFALRNLLWRAARAMIDPQIHTGKMKYDEAVNFLVENVLLERDRAEIEVNRYYYRPVEVASYMIGNLQIQQLREQVKANTTAAEFKLRHFHDNLLKGKELPVPVLAKMRFNQDLALPKLPEEKEKKSSSYHSQ